MSYLIKLEFKKIQPIYLIGLIVGIIFAVSTLFFLREGYVYANNMDLWMNTGDLFTVVFPLFATIPIIWQLVYERKYHYIRYMQTRIPKKKYLIAKWLVSSGSAAFIIFLISFLGLFIALYLFPDVATTDSTLLEQAEASQLSGFGGYYTLNHPLIYGIVVSLWRSVLAIVVNSLGFLLAAYIKNLFVVLISPFVIVQLENFITAVVGRSDLSLSYSFFQSGLTSQAVSIPKYLISPVWIVLLIVTIWIYFAKIKKETIYDV
ncbi:hypothetical protein SAMN05192557_1254 [Aliicoccus persicus]|uniref:ABC-2 family transporter protein n=2 Tax=Aliicoccus persicus TaxID=930138 RepID=A0A662Z4G7_9STAP|nr:hypothetical protein SAMN05192557_1254 [Aliicoccus persicus]